MVGFIPLDLYTFFQWAGLMECRQTDILFFWCYRGGFLSMSKVKKKNIHLIYVGSDILLSPWWLNKQ
jgi:hypothetical protein